MLNGRILIADSIRERLRTAHQRRKMAGRLPLSGAAPLSATGQSLPKRVVRATPLFPLTATTSWTRRNVAKVPGADQIELDNALALGRTYWQGDPHWH